MTRVKICGITTVEDAKAAVDLGADAIGLIFARSPRQVSIRQAVRISKAVAPWTVLVGVFVNEAPERVRAVASECGLSVIQLHGLEAPGDVALIKPLKVVKTFHVDKKFENSQISRYRSADAFLVDTQVAGRLGGTGKVFDWKALKKIDFSKPLIVSGGLNPQNVGAAIRFFKPYGVDVSSGVEKAPGKKNLKKVKQFILNVKKS